VNGLATALERLEVHLRREGAAVMDLARPGIDAARLDEILAPLGLTANTDLRTWFGWHDGAGERLVTPYVQSVLAPGCEFWSAELMASECRQVREVSAELAADPGFPWSVEQMWHPSWFPVLRLFGHGLVAVDLIAGSVHTIWWDGSPEDRHRVRWSSLQAFVEALQRRLHEGSVNVSDDGLVQGEGPEY
jgi:cell wall assembly regulator SMI1